MSYRPRRPPRHETVSLRGVHHHLTRWGDPDAEPLVFLHGWLDTSDTFQFVVDAFAREHAIVAPDWRGFGRSDPSADTYWFPDYFADLEALLDHVAPGRAVSMVGHSMGGNVASLYGGIRPERLARLVNLEGFGLPRTVADAAPERYRRWLDQLRERPSFGRYESLEQFANVLIRRNGRLTPERAEFVARSWAKPLPDGGLTVNADPRHKLVNPVLLVLGGLSEFRAGLGADGTDEYFRALFPTLRIETIADAGHMLHHDRPDRVAELIETFLAPAAHA